jgi:hypothetical protein
VCNENETRCDIYEYQLFFIEGLLILKQERNGLHIRWVVVDEDLKFIYWVDPVCFIIY